MRCMNRLDLDIFLQTYKYLADLEIEIGKKRKILREKILKMELKEGQKYLANVIDSTRYEFTPTAKKKINQLIVEGIAKRIDFQKLSVKLKPPKRL